jgi:hypothetical protein
MLANNERAPFASCGDPEQNSRGQCANARRCGPEKKEQTPSVRPLNQANASQEAFHGALKIIIAPEFRRIATYRAHGDASTNTY